MNITNYLNQIIKLYEYSDDSFYVGKVLASNEEAVVINTISTRGYEDGLYYVSVNDVVRIEANDVYINKYEKLFNNHAQSFVADFKPAEDLKMALLDYVHQKSYIASFQIDNDEWVSGVVLEFFEDSLKINKLNEHGHTDGVSEFKYDAITRMKCNGGDERILSELG